MSIRGSICFVVRHSPFFLFSRCITQARLTVSATFHRLFLEKNRWLMVPEAHIVEEYYISLLLDRFYFPEIKVRFSSFPNFELSKSFAEGELQVYPILYEPYDYCSYPSSNLTYGGSQPSNGGPNHPNPRRRCVHVTHTPIPNPRPAAFTYPSNICHIQCRNEARPNGQSHIMRIPP